MLDWRRYGPKTSLMQCYCRDAFRGCGGHLTSTDITGVLYLTKKGAYKSDEEWLSLRCSCISFICNYVLTLSLLHSADFQVFGSRWVFLHTGSRHDFIDYSTDMKFPLPLIANNHRHGPPTRSILCAYRSTIRIATVWSHFPVLAIGSPYGFWRCYRRVHERL